MRLFAQRGFRLFQKVVPPEYTYNIFGIYSEYNTNFLLVITLARFFVNSQSTLAYTKFWSLLDKYTTQLLGKRLQWFHIHGNGIKAIIMDMDGASIKGQKYLNILRIYY